MSTMVCYAADFKKQPVVRQINNGVLAVSHSTDRVGGEKKLAGIIIFAAGFFFHTMHPTGLFPD
jgi:hypothetical protein